MASHFVGSRRWPRSPPPAPPAPPRRPGGFGKTAQFGGDQTLRIIGIFCFANCSAICNAAGIEFIAPPPPPPPPRALGAVVGADASSGCHTFHGSATRP